MQSSKTMETDAIQRDIAKVDGKSNSLSVVIPISRLPLELLERIFNIARSQGTQTIHLSWVSHAWRTLALDRKTLWTLIDNASVRWTSIYLDRSFPAPLVVHFPTRCTGRDGFSKIIEQLPRIKAFILPGTEAWTFSVNLIVQGTFSRSSSAPLPHLNTLQLGGGAGKVNKDMLFSLRNVVHLSLHQTSFEVRMDNSQVLNTLLPNLQRALTLTHLRTLNISRGHAGWNMRQFVEIFGGLPALDFLSIWGLGSALAEFFNPQLLDDTSTSHELSPPPPFPALRVFATFITKECYDAFIKFLLMRRDRRYRFERLVLMIEYNRKLRGDKKMFSEVADEVVLTGGQGEAEERERVRLRTTERI